MREHACVNAPSTMSRRMSARSASRGTGPADEAVRGAAFSVLGSRPRRWGCEGGDLYGRNAGKCGGGAASWEESGAREEGDEGTGDDVVRSGRRHFQGASPDMPPAPGRSEL